MIYPSIDKILNVIDSKYELVHVASRRAKQMQQYDHYQMKDCEYKNKKEIGRALEEIDNGLITVHKN